MINIGDVWVCQFDPHVIILTEQLSPTEHVRRRSCIMVGEWKMCHCFRPPSENSTATYELSREAVVVAARGTICTTVHRRARILFTRSKLTRLHNNLNVRRMAVELPNSQRGR